VTPTLPHRPGRAADADPDVDGVALAAATATRVLLGTRFAVAAAWVAATCLLAVACLGTGSVPRFRDEGGGAAVVGVLVLGTLLAAGAAAASVPATAVRGGVLVAWAGQPGRVEATATVAEEPRRLRYSGCDDEPYLVKWPGGCATSPGPGARGASLMPKENPTADRQQLVVQVGDLAAAVGLAIRTARRLHLPVEPGVREGRDALVRWAVLLEEILPPERGLGSI